jgi:hypothetical protein
MPHDSRIEPRSYPRMPSTAYSCPVIELSTAVRRKEVHHIVTRDAICRELRHYLGAPWLCVCIFYVGEGTDYRTVL